MPWAYLLLFILSYWVQPNMLFVSFLGMFFSHHGWEQVRE